MMASLSRLFSESNTPYLDYRLAENLFCKYFQADNDARACTAYDAHFPMLGVGIKTFVLHGGSSTEKIAEFNKIKPRLDALRGKDLAVALALCRNERMQISNNAYSLTSAIYHIVGRDENSLIIFNQPYDFVNIDGICDVIDKGVSLRLNLSFGEALPSWWQGIDVQPQQRPRRVAAQKGNGQKARRARHNARPRVFRIR